MRLARLKEAFDLTEDNPYSVPLHVVIAVDYLGLGYPDLAAGSAYKALLLSDALDNDAEEYHDEACESLKITIQEQPLEERIKIIRHAMDAGIENGDTATELDPTLDIEITLWLKIHYRLIMYRLLARSLLLCRCLRSAHSYAQQGLALYAKDAELTEIMKLITGYATKILPQEIVSSPNEWPDSGLVRREVYPWNKYEADRMANMDWIQTEMEQVSTKLEVRIVELPSLIEGVPGTVKQLGVFAKEDIKPGEIVLDERSFLTANNKLQDALCDACSKELPEVGSPEWQESSACDECEVVFCSEDCRHNAFDAYHSAICGKDVEAIAKDVPPAEAADSLYSLLLLRTFAMAETEEHHPLETLDTRYLWGDFLPAPEPDTPTFSNYNSPDSCLVTRTLPFSFDFNIRLPFHMLEKMDIDIFASTQYDVWVFNTLYSKFRGTASARLSGLGGSAIRGPEVSAVHPMWCMANHSCDPNVSWEWGGTIKFEAKKERVQWYAGKNNEKGGIVRSKAGIKKGEEILNHYCDINLPVKERREWARGALGGDCQCARCVFEAQVEAEEAKEQEQ